MSPDVVFFAKRWADLTIDKTDRFKAVRKIHFSLIEVVLNVWAPTSLELEL